MRDYKRFDDDVDEYEDDQSHYFLLVFKRAPRWAYASCTCARLLDHRRRRRSYNSDPKIEL